MLEEKLTTETKLKEEFTSKAEMVRKEMDEVQRELEQERGKGGDYTEKLTKMAAQKKDMEQQLAVRLNDNLKS